MKKYVYDEVTDKLLETVDAEPECGKDFCDSCGDCLHCYEGDLCHEREDGEHLWVEYREHKTVPANS